MQGKEGVFCMKEKASIRKNPKVSIIIPVYNGANFLEKAIVSSLNQTYPNIEVLVINDGSNDNGETERIALSYANSIRYITKENGGVSSALNKGIQEMKGEYFSWLSHDDEYYPEKIQKQMEAIQKHGNDKTIALCGTEFIDEFGKVLKKKWGMPKAGYYSSEYALNQLGKKTFSGIALLIPRKAFEDKRFDESLHYIQDVIMWRQLFLAGYDLVVDEQILVKSRLHRAQQTNNHRERFAEETSRTAVDYSKQLCARGYYRAALLLWYSLLKKESKESYKEVEKVLKESKQIHAKEKLAGYFLKGYGRIRPEIRKLYYRFRFHIDSR